MGTNLNILYKGKVIAGLVRKHYFTFYGDQQLPTEDVADEHIANSRQHIVSTLVSYASWLASQDQDKMLTENMDDIVSSIKDLIEIFEYDVSVAAKNSLLRDIVDQYDDEGNPSDDLEVVDDMEVDRRDEDKKKKQKYMENLRNQMIKDGTDDSDLEYEDGWDDWDEDTLVGKEWEEPEDKCGSIKIGEKATKGW